MAQVIATTTCRSVSSHAEAHTRNASVSCQKVPSTKLPTCPRFFLFSGLPSVCRWVRGPTLMCTPSWRTSRAEVQSFFVRCAGCGDFLLTQHQPFSPLFSIFNFLKKKNAKPIAAATLERGARATRIYFTAANLSGVNSLVGWCLAACIQTARNACDIRMYLLQQREEKGTEKVDVAWMELFTYLVLLQSHGVFVFAFIVSCPIVGSSGLFQGGLLNKKNVLTCYVEG